MTHFKCIAIKKIEVNSKFGMSSSLGNNLSPFNIIHSPHRPKLKAHPAFIFLLYCTFVTHNLIIFNDNFFLLVGFKNFDILIIP